MIVMKDKTGQAEQQHEDFKKVVHDLYNDVEIPDAAGTWQKAQQQLQKRRRRIKWMNRIKVSAGIVVVSLFINLVLNLNMSVTYAGFSSLFKEAKEHVIQIFFQEPDKHENNAHAKTPPPPPDNVNETEPAAPEMTTLEDARAKVAFPIMTPEYLPQGFELDIVRIFRENGNQYKNVYLEYVNDAGKIIKLSQRLVDDQSGAVKTEVAADAGEIKEIYVQGLPAALIIWPEGMHSLEWLTRENIKISISGELTERELLKFAESLSKE